jgi:hypothetical protein
MERLDSELTAEVKKRMEMNKSTQVWFEEELLKLNKAFHETLEQRTAIAAAKLEELNLRITRLDRKFEAEKEAMLSEIERRGEELRKMLEAFKAEFDKDKEMRLQREEVMVKQLTDHEHEVSEKFEVQIGVREARYQELKLVLEENIKLRDRSESRFQNFFEKEVHKLYDDVQSEVEVREREDDEIMQALNRYTLKLQNSLKIINSTDT